MSCLFAGKADKAGRSADVKPAAKAARKDAAAAITPTKPAADAQPVIASRPRTLPSLRSKPKACVRMSEAVYPAVVPSSLPASPAGKGNTAAAAGSKGGAGAAGKAGGSHLAVTGQQKGAASSSTAGASGKGAGAGASKPPSSKRCACPQLPCTAMVGTGL